MEQHLGARYEIQKILGEGGFGIVLLVKDLHEDSFVAVKVLRKQKLCRKSATVACLKNERGFLEELRGVPYVSQMIFAKDSPENLYIGMEFCQGGDLKQLIKNYGPFPDSATRFYAAEIVLGLTEIHRRGIVHLDLKPSNFLVTNSGHLQLADFGLSLRLLPGQRMEGTVGTPIYRPPEMFSTSFSFEADIWAFSCIIVEIYSR